MKPKTLGVYVLLLSIIISFAANLHTVRTQQLNLTITTDKSYYTYRQRIEIDGNLTLDGNPTSGLVGIEIDDPNNHPIVTRTASVGATPNGTIEILTVTPCDEMGNPKTTFNKNNHAHVNITVRNNDENPHNILITLCTYDRDSTPISPWINMLQTTILSEATIQYKPNIYIESWVSTGPALFHVNVYSDWPKNGGYPYAPEKMVTFNIVSEGAAKSATQHEAATIQSESAYMLASRLPPEAPFGTYTINAVAYSQTQTISSSTTFSRPFQILGDINFDHVVNIVDIVTITLIYGSKSYDPLWNPKVDIDPDAVIDIRDVVIAVLNYGTIYSSRTSASARSPRDTDAPPQIDNTQTQSETRTTQMTTPKLFTGIDIYTQYPEPYNGIGLNQPSDMYWPEKEVTLYAYVAYNSWPEQQKDVAFQIIDPHGSTLGILHNRTDIKGITFVRFQLPSEDLEYYFGEWTIVATVDVAGKIYRDTLTFKYDYHARLWCNEIFTDRSSYKHGEMIELTIEYGTQSMQKFPAVFIVKALDETGTPFAFQWIINVVGDAQYCTYANGNSTLNLQIPKFACAGAATLYVELFHQLEDGEPLCPSCIVTFQIEA